MTPEEQRCKAHVEVKWAVSGIAVHKSIILGRPLTTDILILQSGISLVLACERVGHLGPKHSSPRSTMLSDERQVFSSVSTLSNVCAMNAE